MGSTKLLQYANRLADHGLQGLVRYGLLKTTPRLSRDYNLCTPLQRNFQYTYSGAGEMTLTHYTTTRLLGPPGSTQVTHYLPD